MSELEKYLDENVDVLDKEYSKKRTKLAREYFQKRNYELSEADVGYIKGTTLKHIFFVDKRIQKQREKNGLSQITEF